jgi:hypothetical protein
LVIAHLVSLLFDYQRDPSARRKPPKRRLADEYDAAQERGEVATGSVRTDIVPVGNDVRPATAAEIGLSRKEVHEARQIRDAERRDPGIVRRLALVLSIMVAIKGRRPRRRRADRTAKDRASAFP